MGTGVTRMRSSAITHTYASISLGLRPIPRVFASLSRMDIPNDGTCWALSRAVDEELCGLSARPPWVIGVVLVTLINQVGAL
jgi:hypothetical protein